MYRFIFLLFLKTSLVAQHTKTIDLYEWQQQGKLSIVNREVEAVVESASRFIRLTEKSSEGIVWLPITDFKNGVIELEMRGKDVFQKSFIGIVFHALNDSTYDAVYCRPFNFQAKDSIRKIHAIQYISHPAYTWKKLREEKNGRYEKEIIAPPNPNGWFTLKLVVVDNLSKAFIDQSEQPSLTIEKILDNQTGRIGIFMGAGSGGDFKSITVRYAN